MASLKILRVTTSNHLSFSDHIQHTISSCTQTHYAVKILRAHGAIDTVLQQAYRSVILSKVLQYIISSVWCGFTTVSERQQINNFTTQSVKSGFCRADQTHNLPGSLQSTTRSALASATSVFCKPELQPQTT